MSHSVKFVEPDALPAGHQWLMVRDEEGNVYVFVGRPYVFPRVLEEAWAAYRMLARQELSVAS